jgi:hypothetical protein
MFNPKQKKMEQEELFPVVSINSETGEVEEHESLVVSPTQFDATKLSSLMNDSTKLEMAKKTISIVPVYYEFEKIGDSMRGIFAGHGNINKRTESGEFATIKVVKWLNNGKMYMNGGVALVDKFDHLPVGTPVEITYIMKNGKTKVYDVVLLQIEEG